MHFVQECEYIQGWVQRFWKGWGRGGHVRRPPCLADEENVGFRWSKKAKIKLENISIIIFKFSIFLYASKACRWNLIIFFKFANTLIRKEKNNSCSSQWEKLRKVELYFITGCFIKLFNMIIIFLFRQLIRSAIFAFWYQGDARNIKRGNWERQMAMIEKLRYLFQK